MGRWAPSTRSAVVRRARRKLVRVELSLRFQDRIHSLLKQIRKRRLQIVEGRLQVRPRREIRTPAILLPKGSRPPGDAAVLLDARIRQRRTDSRRDLRHAG